MATTIERPVYLDGDGSRPQGARLANAGIVHPGDVYWNLSIPRLVEEALKRGEGELAANGALAAQTGKYTGRSPEDKFVVKHASYEKHIWWGKVNQPMEPATFERLHARMAAYLQ